MVAGAAVPVTEVGAAALLFAGAVALYFALRSSGGGAAQSELIFPERAASSGLLGTLADGVKAVASNVSGKLGGFDAVILSAARKWNIPPHVLKAIVSVESAFDPEAINPEKTFTLGGVTYGPNDKIGRATLREWIKTGNAPSAIGLSPSLGLAQIRTGIAANLGFKGATRELFDPAVNLNYAAALLAEMFGQGVTLETIDAYNVGAPRVLKGTLRNLAYRDKVNAAAAKYQGDF